MDVPRRTDEAGETGGDPTAPGGGEGGYAPGTGSGAGDAIDQEDRTDSHRGADDLDAEGA